VTLNLSEANPVEHAEIQLSTVADCESLARSDDPTGITD